MIDIFCRLDDKGYRRPFVYEPELLELLEEAITDTIHWCLSDVLPTLVDAVDAAQGLSSSINHALQAAVMQELEENTSRISEDDSESSLSDRIDVLKKFAPRFGVPEDVLSNAISAIEDRIGEIEGRSSLAVLRQFS